MHRAFASARMQETNKPFSRDLIRPGKRLSAAFFDIQSITADRRHFFQKKHMKLIALRSFKRDPLWGGNIEIPNAKHPHLIHKGAVFTIGEYDYEDRASRPHVPPAER